MAVDITTIGVEFNTSSLKAGTIELEKAAKAGDKLDNSIKDIGKTSTASFTEAERASKLAGNSIEAMSQKSVSSLTRSRQLAQSLGYQLQDVAVQAQMGASWFTIIGQQGSQFLSVFGGAGAIAGALLAVGAALAGVVFKGLMASADAAKHFDENLKLLIHSMRELDPSQRVIVNDAIALKISELTKKYKEEQVAIEEKTKAIRLLNEENGKQKLSTAVSYGTAGLSANAQAMRETIDNTKAIAAATEDLNKLKTNGVSIQKEIDALNDPEGRDKALSDLKKEVDLIGLKGKAYWDLKAAQEGYSGAQKDEYVNLQLLGEEKKKQLKLTEDAAKEAEQLAKKNAADAEREAKRIVDAEIRRTEQINRSIVALEKEGALFGSQSKYEEILYDIEHAVIKVTDAERERYLAAAQVYDQNVKMQKLADDIVKNLPELKFDNSSLKQTEEIFKRIDQAAVNVWQSVIDGSSDAFDGIKKLFQNLLAELAHEALTKPIILNIQQALSSKSEDKSSAGGGLVAAGGIWGAVAAAVVVGVSIYNKEQKKGFEQLTAAYKQANDYTGTVLGDISAHSESLNNSITVLGDTAKNTLNVNNGMYTELVAIKNGISGVAASFSRQLGIGNGQATISSTDNLWSKYTGGGNASLSLDFAKSLKDDPIVGKVASFFASFGQGVYDKISSAIYNTKKKTIDSGIQITGSTLADIFEKGTIEAFNYASVQTTKKFLGITTSNKVKDQVSALDSEFENQIASIFENAGDALKSASGILGLNFDPAKLIVEATKLSLKDLKGDDLVNAIEGFFSSTLDKWAGTIASGSNILSDFQKVGEGAFETFVRLAGEVNTFSYYAEGLNLNFKATGVNAVYATEAIAKAAGGFDQLASSLSGYYQNFFSDSERNAKQLADLGEAMKSLGVDTVPASREAFRALIESIDLATAAGQQQFAGLINLQGAFAAVIPATEAATQAVKDNADALRERAGLENELLQLQGNTQEIRRRELEALDPSNRAIQQQIYALKDLQAATDAATQAAEAAANAQSAIASQRYNLETQLLQLQGDTVSLRNRELAALDPSNRALQEQIYALTDKQQADSIAAKAAQDAAKAQEDAANEAAKAAQDQIKAMESVHSSISSALKSMMGESEVFAESQRKQAKVTLSNALAVAQAGGSLVGFAGLDEALATIQKLDKSTFANSLDYNREFGQSVGLLSQLDKYTRVNGSHANGLSRVPFDGYVAQLHKGERVQTASQADSSDNQVSAAIRVMGDKIERQNIAIAQTNSKIAKIIEKWDGDGMPEVRTA